MNVEVKEVSKAGWTPLPHNGCVRVEVKGLVRLKNLSLAMLRFDTHATIHEHPADFDVDVICLEGGGFTSVGPETVALNEDDVVRWPAGVPHRLWTEDRTMVTLMIEQQPKYSRPTDE